MCKYIVENEMILFLISVVMCSFNSVFGEYDLDKMENCQRYPGGDLYFLDGQTIHWYNSVQGHAWIKGCINEDNGTHIEDFDPELIVKHGYYKLTVDDMVWPTIPEAATPQEVFMKGVTPTGVFGGCSQLNKLDIYPPANLSLISPDWLANCTQLRELRLGPLNLLDIKKVLDSVSKVREVNLIVNHFEDVLWNPIFPAARGAHLWIEGFHLSTPFSEPAENVSWAQVSESIVWQLSLLPRLEEISIDGMDSKLDWCGYHNSSSVTFKSLKSLTLKQTATTEVCFRTRRISPKLKLLQSSLDTIQFRELISTCAPQIDVVYVETIIFYREDYLLLSDCTEPEKAKITTNALKINCDCGQSLWLRRAVLEGYIESEYARCSDGTALEDQTCDWLYCTRVICNSTCVCCDDTNHGIVMDCRDANLTAIPEEVNLVNNLTELLIPWSNLTELPETLPESLIFIDISGNNLLQDMNNSEIATLFERPDRIVRLAWNPIICSCDHQLLIEELQRHSKQIEDYSSMVCAGESRSLSEVNAAILCDERNRAANTLIIVSVALVVAIFALLIGILLYYRRQIKIFLFARGWCLFCINEEELDADRRYDVFLSFCHSDDTLVLEELLPRLDEEYSVCMHYRDWNPGDMIPSQIWKSVEQSRRTIIVLSSAFVKSLWGLLEFRSAYVSGLSEGRIRVVMIVLDDVLEKEELEGEIRAYVRLNTYVKWGDPWFWDKLRFALPHRPAKQQDVEEIPPSQNPPNMVNFDPQMEMIAIQAGGPFIMEAAQDIPQISRQFESGS